MPVKSIIEFILVIAPGFLVLHIYRSHYPAKRVSQFTEITLSVVYGVGIYATVVLIDSTFLSNWLANKIQVLVFVLLATAFVVGRFWVWLRFLRFNLPDRFPLREKIGPKRKEHQAVWPLVVNEAPLDDWAVVYLNDSSIYMGTIDYFTFDPNAENQDFLLINARRVDDNLKETYLVDGIGVYLNTKDVIRIEFLKGKN